MVRYGSGVTFKAACEMDREQIMKALSQQIVCGENDNGFVYDTCTKEEADKTVIDIFDSLVYQARQSNAVSRAMEKYLTKKMGKRWMKLFNKGFLKSGYVDKEILEEFGDEYLHADESDDQVAGE